jgi:hypothetical protein
MFLRAKPTLPNFRLHPEACGNLLFFSEIVIRDKVFNCTSSKPLPFNQSFLPFDKCLFVSIYFSATFDETNQQTV